jgi:integrase
VPRTLRDSKLDSREARSRLKVQGKPYKRLIEPGLHLLYRRLAGRPGSWGVRRYLGNQVYLESSLGAVADDYADADGATVLSFAQAQVAALAHKPKATGPLTVRQAVEAYLGHLEGRGGTPDAWARVEAWVFPQLGNVEVEDLTTEQIRAWHTGLATTPARIRTSAGKRQRYAELDDSDEGKRRRRASANRVLAILKAALNFTFREGMVASDISWRRCRPFVGADAARTRYLTSAESKRLVNACEPAFRHLVQGALATGCRYGELCRLRVGDFNPEGGSLLIYRSKAGKPRHVVLTDEATALFASWCAGRAADDFVFSKDGKPWTRSTQFRPMREACKRARIAGASFHSLRHTWASHAVMNGVPLMIVARNLGHTDTRMLEKNYGHLAPNYIADAIRAGAPRFGFKPDPTVVAPLRR